MQNMNLPNHPNQFSDDEDGVDYKRIIFLLLDKWYWIAICIFVALMCAFFYNRYSRQVYSIDTSIIVPENNKNLDLQNMLEKSVIGGSADMSIGNEIELLKSYTLSRRVFEKLNWRTSWYQKQLFTWSGLYLNETFIVSEDEKAANTEGLMLYVEPDGDDTYRISADGTVLINNQEEDIAFSGTGQFGKPFVNPYFHFTLYRKENGMPAEDREFSFRFNSINDLTKAYLKKLKVEQTSKQNEVIRLSLEGIEPLREIHYLNQLISEYTDLKLEFQTETQKRSLEFINSQLGGISDSLNAAGTSVTDFRTKNQVLDISAEGQIVLTQLSDIEKERSQSRIQLDYFGNLLHYLGNTDSIKKMVMPSVVGIQDPSLNAIVMKLTDLYSQREVLSFSTHENNPTMILLNKEIGQITTQLRENLVNLIDNSKLTIENLKRRQDAISRQLNNLPGKEQKLINITRQYDLTNEIYTFLLQKRAETEIAMASTVSDIQVIDPARLERIEESGLSPKVYYLLAFVLGLVLPGGVILITDSLNNTIHLQEDVEKLTSLTIIGNIIHSHSKNELVVVENPRAPITESFRSVRTNLQYMFSKNGHQVIGIHSIRPGEGKSFNSVNLACILAVNDKKVLLIGADMRKPRLHLMLNTLNDVGLSTFLISESSYEDVILKSGIDNLWVLPSGPIPPNPAELLERDSFRTLLERARKEFDYIVVDNAPASLVTDGLITSRLADLNIFILRYGVSRKDQLKFINDMASQGVMNHCALVINDIKLGRFGYGYGYSYNYSYGKGYYGENGKKHHYRGKSRFHIKDLIRGQKK